MRTQLNVRFTTVVAALVLMTGALTGCRDEPLAVENRNQPDVDRAYSTPAGVETIVSKLFQQLHQGQFGTSDNLWTQTMTMSFESHSQLGNFGMGTRAQIPRAFIDNNIGNREEIGNFRDFDFMSRNARSASNAVTALKKFAAAGASTGTAARDARALSFAYFSLGYGHGQVALFYDSAAVMVPGTDPSEVPPFAGAAAVMTEALKNLDSALAVSNRAALASGAEAIIPAAWMSQAADISMARWREIIRSYKARFRAGVARTPAERQAVDWSAVIADATNGIQSDLIVTLTVSGGWTNSWIQTALIAAGWHQMTPFIIGMADTTGAYTTWLNQALTARVPFLIRTPDKRLPSGVDRPTQQLKTGVNRYAPDTVLYMRNRPEGEDTPGEPWGTSFYDWIRVGNVRQNNGNGPYFLFTRAEVDMLAAEGYLRAGAPNFAAAALLIDRYRVPNGLASVVGLNSLTTPVPGGISCVPRVPVPPGTSTACGGIFEAMKWEKRMETGFTGYGQWLVDSRGWGDLIQGTPLEWPVPYQELFARGRPTYTSSRVAARSTYDWE